MNNDRQSVEIEDQRIQLIAELLYEVIISEGEDE